MTGAPAHERYAAELAALTRHDVLLDALGHRDGGWRATYGRFMPDAEPFATLAFERDDPVQEILVLEAHAGRPAAPGAVPLPGAESAWLVPGPFPADPALPGLPALLAGPGRRTIVRYRPRMRCTVLAQDGGTTRYAKVFPGTDGEPLHRDTVALWQASEDGRLGFVTAAPDRYDAATGTVWQHQIPGEPLKPRLLSPEGPDLAVRMGRALATLRDCGIRPARPVGPGHPLVRAGSAARDLARRVPGLAPAVDAVMSGIERLHRAAGERAAQPIHGAAHPSQWLLSEGRLGLVDFDRFGLGDPELELAVFLAEVDFETGAPSGVDAAFVGGYEEGGAALDRRLLVAYRAAGRLAKARRTARQIRPDGAERAERDLARAAETLDTRGP
jgi:Ser/Thr protein kinase RdoA (MazF antagonist)